MVEDDLQYASKVDFDSALTEIKANQEFSEKLQSQITENAALAETNE